MESSMLNNIVKCVVDMDEMPVVICDINHTIIYMNPSSIKRYRKRGGSDLIGKCIFDCHNPQSVDKIKKVVKWFEADKSHNKVFTFSRCSEGLDYDVYMIALRDDFDQLIGYYEKHESRLHETMEMYKLD